MNDILYEQIDVRHLNQKGSLLNFKILALRLSHTAVISKDINQNTIMVSSCGLLKSPMKGSPGYTTQKPHELHKSHIQGNTKTAKTVNHEAADHMIGEVKFFVGQ